MKSPYQMYEIVNTRLILLVFMKGTPLKYVSLYTQQL